MGLNQEVVTSYMVGMSKVLSNETSAQPMK